MTDKPSQVRLTGQLICRNQDELDRVMEQLPRHIELTAAEPGCREFSVRQTEDPFVWQVDEVFVDEVSFSAHQERAGASEWGRATASIERRYDLQVLD